MSCLVFTPEFARADTKQTAIYEVYAGGIHAVQAQLDINVKKDRYDIVLSAKTRGFLSKLAPWHGTFESHGWVLGDGVFQPELHRSTTTWKDEKEVKSYNYTKGGGFKNLVIQDHDKPEQKPEIDPELTKDTTDAFTAALSVLKNFDKESHCEGKDEVFDGERRFEQVFTYQKNENLVPSDYNIFQGDAAECTIEVVPVAGKWHEKPRGWMSIQEQGRDRGMMPTMWIGKMDPAMPAIPVKIRVKTAYGTLFMHLAEYRSGDTVYVAEKRETDE